MIPTVLYPYTENPSAKKDLRGHFLTKAASLWRNGCRQEGGEPIYERVLHSSVDMLYRNILLQT